ncbi:MAG: type II secretion system protein [Candidatus Sungbacteria bacterium]|uniref:Type II secretion system protein n=1 Tax=Candidatus Sungiibacteriota bacterium TaxID=2750080 RepID=A0A931SEE9_9BACT|nr:type II secretion system protein [Candidatus Sungbacteria bacterium]
MLYQGLSRQSIRNPASFLMNQYKERQIPKVLRPHMNVLTGFTMVEIVVMLAIIVFISAVVLANFPGFNENGALIRGQQELASNFRRLQSYVLSVSNVPLQNGSLEKNPPVVGAHFDKGATSYILFVDSPTGALNQYDVENDKLIATVQFLRRISLNKLYVVAGGACINQEFLKLDVVFRSPEARLTLSGDGAKISDSCSFAKIEMKTPSLGLVRTVSVWVTGQIGMQ